MAIGTNVVEWKLVWVRWRVNLCGRGCEGVAIGIDVAKRQLVRVWWRGKMNACDGAAIGIVVVEQQLV